MSKLIHIPSHLDALHQVGDLVNPARWNFHKLAMALLQPHQVLPPMLIYTQVLIQGLDFLLRQVNLPYCLKSVGIAIDAQPRESLHGSCWMKEYPNSQHLVQVCLHAVLHEVSVETICLIKLLIHLGSCQASNSYLSGCPNLCIKGNGQRHLGFACIVVCCTQTNHETTCKCSHGTHGCRVFGQ